MTVSAVLLLALGLLLAEPVSRGLAAARWTYRAPRAALVLWQAIGLAAGLAAIGAGVTYAVGPLGASLPEGVAALVRQSLRLQPFAGLTWPHVVALLGAALLAARLLGVLLLSAVRTLRERRRHRVLVDLVATPWPDLGGARVLDHPDAVAYCLPGLRSRVVLSTGALEVLEPDELTAVLVHERAHLAQRHDLVVLPFVAWGAALPFVTGVCRAQAAVATLVEMLADDWAKAVADRTALASAIARVGLAGPPRGALAMSGSGVVDRVHRLLDPDPPAPLWLPMAAYCAAALLVGLPTALLLTPAL